MRPRARLDELRLAFMLLSRIPMGTLARAPALSDCVWAYPLVGAVVGGLAGLVCALAARLGLPPLAGALLALWASALLTGAMHEDGLADLADGFGGGATKVRKLEIMRDSRIGSYGVLALILAVGVKAACLAALPPAGAWLSLAALGALSRAVLPMVMLALPSARESGLGQAAGGALRPWPALAGLVLALLLAGLCALPHLGAVVLAMALVSAGVSVLARRQIGGFTGDVLGAVQNLAELAGFCALVGRF